METPLAEKMYRRTRDAPMSRRSSIDLLFIMQRHAVFAIDQDSADHISDIIFAQQDAKILELLNDFHQGYDPSRRHQPRPAPKLRAAIADARQKWTEILRDEDLVDIRIIVFPSEERDFEHISPPVDVNEHPYGNQLQRFQGLKRKLVEEGGGMPYRLKPRFRNRTAMEVDLIIRREALERIATPYMQMVLNFKIHTITAPAPHSSSEQHRPDTERLWREGPGSAHLNMENLARILRQRSSPVQQAVREAPKLPWNFPFSAGSRVRLQREWTGDERPFARDLHDLGSNNDWVKKDLEVRTAQIDEWVATKKSREAALRTSVPDANFRRLEGLAQCETYTADGSEDWYETHLGGNVFSDYTAARRDIDVETMKYRQTLETWQALKAQKPQNAEVLEYYRQMLEGQMKVLDRAKQQCTTISQGLPATAPKQRVMTCQTPMQDTQKLSLVQAQTEEYSQIEGLLSPERQSLPRANVQKPTFEGQKSQVHAPTPGHTPMLEVKKGLIECGPTLRPSARPTATKRRNGGEDAPAGDDTSTGRLPARRSSANLTRVGRTAVRSRRLEDSKLVSKAAIDQAEHKLVVGPGGAMRKVARQVSFRLPGETLPSPIDETPSQVYQSKGQSSPDQEGKNLAGSAMIPSTGKTIDGQDLAPLCRVPSLVRNNGAHGAPFKSSTAAAVPPTVSPATPKDFKVRGSRFRKSKNDAQQTLKLAADKDDMVNPGSPQGRFPSFRRVVSDMTGGLA